MLEDIRGLNVFGVLTGVPGEVTLSLGADGTQVPEASCVSVVTFGIDELRRVYIEVSRGSHLWNLDGKLLVPRKREYMMNRGSFIESRAVFNGRVWFRWSANLLNDLRLRFFAEEPMSVARSAQLC